MIQLRLFAGLLLVAGAVRVDAQSDTSRCDAIVRAARVDSVPTGLFIAVQRLDGGGLDAAQSAALASQIGSMFTAPTPFPLTVFSGPVVMRALSQFGLDSAGTLRSPAVEGVYRFATAASGALRALGTVRASLTPGFDSAATTAIRNAAALPGGLAAPDRGDSMIVDVRIASDSGSGGLKMLGAYFPRMPVIDAKPRRGNPPAVFPDDERRDSVETGDAILRFVVDRFGVPVPATVEVVRATSESFYHAAMNAVSSQAFEPATIRGCPVAQVVTYPFTFVAPDSAEREPRH